MKKQYIVDLEMADDYKFDEIKFIQSVIKNMPNNIKICMQEQEIKDGSR